MPSDPRRIRPIRASKDLPLAVARLRAAPDLLSDEEVENLRAGEFEIEGQLAMGNPFGALPVNMSSRDFLYLDYDGVLHPEDVRRYRSPPSIRLAPEFAGHSLFESCGVLEQLLSPYPQVKLILSTSWVRELDYSRAKGRLTPELMSRVLGATFHARHHRRDQFSKMTRYSQIMEDVIRRQPDRWLAIDDDHFGWDPNVAAKLVHTPPVGLADHSARERLRVALERTFGATGQLSGPASGSTRHS